VNKNYLLVPIFLLFLFSCTNKEVQAELDALKARSDLEQQNLDLVERFIGTWNARDYEMNDEFLAPDFKIYLPSNVEEPMSMEDYEKWFGGLFQNFPDLQFNIMESFASGDKVCIRWELEATLPGADPAVPDPGNKLTGTAIEIYTVKDGMIVEERAEEDALGVQLQLGFTLVPPDAAGE
jgi:predicted ester cyclase